MSSSPIFDIFVNLGTITVPPHYDHSNHLAHFREKHWRWRNQGSSLYGYDQNITDERFSNPTCILKPGDKLSVRVFHQKNAFVAATSEECMAFLKTLDAFHTGAQGMALVFDQKRDLLPKENRWEQAGKQYTSFDEKSQLLHVEGKSKVPYVCAHAYDKFFFALGNFEDPRDVKSRFLCFRTATSS